MRGAVLVGATSAELMSALTTQGVPFAVLGNNVVGEWQPHACDTVFLDGVQGASEMTEFLIELGHVNIWYVADCTLPWFAQSAEGYRRSMEGSRSHTTGCGTTDDRTGAWVTFAPNR